jgi:NitT/TauT family transport system substrate-binding protein
MYEKNSNSVNPEFGRIPALRAAKRGTGFTAALLLTTVILLALAGCSPKKTAGAPLDIFLRNNALSDPVVVAAKALGYFEEEGVAANFIFISAGDVEALSIGKADVLLNGLIPPLSYAAQGSDLKIVGGTLSGGNYVIVKPENARRYQAMTAWRGARLGTVRLSTSEMASRYALGQIGLNLDASSGNQDVTFVEIESYANIIEGVVKGQVEIGFISYEYRQPALDRGLVILYPMTDMYPNYVCCRETAYGPSLIAKRDTFVKYNVAKIRTYKYFSDHREEVIAILAEASSQEPEFIRDVFFNPEASGGRSWHPDPDFERVSEVYDVLKKYNYIPSDRDITEIYDVSVYQDALEIVLRRYPGDPFYLEMKAYFEANNSRLLGT